MSRFDAYRDSFPDARLTPFESSRFICSRSRRRTLICRSPVNPAQEPRLLPP
jgi:hypothetical protein